MAKEDTIPPERYLRTMFANAPIGVDVVAADGRWLHVNEALLSHLGLDRDQMLSEKAQDRTHPDDMAEERRNIEGILSGVITTYRMEKRVRHADGHYLPIHATVVGVVGPSGAVEGFVAMCEDITTRKTLEHVLTEQATRDPLTHIANRVALQKAADDAPSSPDASAGLIVLDLDGFKEVNDNYGHEAGDGVLQSVAAALQAAVRPGELAARLGGDEFVLLILGLPADRIQANIAVDTARSRFEDALAGVRTPGHTPIRASVGSAIGSGQTVRLAQLLREADRAMYTAKAGRHSV